MHFASKWYLQIISITVATQVIKSSNAKPINIAAYKDFCSFDKIYFNFYVQTLNAAIFLPWKMYV